jgi:AcrR family transcriptional regulator
MSDDQATEAAAARPSGRRPGSSGTKQAILDAARARFSTEGYATTTIRRIAADAGVDPSLVMQFYGSKDALFVTVMELPPEALDRLANAFDGHVASLGERVTAAFLELWEGDPRTSVPLIAMLRSAISNEHAAASLREFIQARLVEQISPKLAGSEDASVRAGFASAMLVGVIVSREIVKVPILAATDREKLIRLVAPAVQGLLAGGIVAARS